MSDHALTMGVFATSFKENEFRLPIHPDHLDKIDPALRSRIYLEKGYGSLQGISAPKIEGFAGYLEREELFRKCDILLLPKPCDGDLPFFREGQILWGWPHCVQGPAITQVGIDLNMTFIAWEEMHQWRISSDDRPQWVVHTFHKNNELAGYCSVLHALQLRGFSGHYGEQKKAAVLSFGSTAQGACYALQALGIQDITVFKQRAAADLAYQIPTLMYRQFLRAEEGSRQVVAEHNDGNGAPIIDVLCEYDIIVNCILQDPLAPLDFVAGDEDIARLKRGSLTIDVSCDAGMGFSFTKPTTFEDPIFTVNDHVNCYAVDHSPSYLWDSATFEISTALLPYLPDVMAGKQAWSENLTLEKAIEILEGKVQNPKILSFQNRSAEYPYPIQAGK